MKLIPTQVTINGTTTTLLLSEADRARYGLTTPAAPEPIEAQTEEAETEGEVDKSKTTRRRK